MCRTVPPCGSYTIEPANVVKLGMTATTPQPSHTTATTVSRNQKKSRDKRMIDDGSGAITHLWSGGYA